MSWKPWTIRILYVGHEINRNNGITWYLKKPIGKKQQQQQLHSFNVWNDLLEERQTFKLVLILFIN